MPTIAIADSNHAVRLELVCFRFIELDLSAPMSENGGASRSVAIGAASSVPHGDQSPVEVGPLSQLRLELWGSPYPPLRRIHYDHAGRNYRV